MTVSAKHDVMAPAGKPLVIVLGEDTYPYQYLDEQGNAQQSPIPKFDLFQGIGKILLIS
jgi:hypothetical protein